MQKHRIELRLFFVRCNACATAAVFVVVAVAAQTHSLFSLCILFTWFNRTLPVEWHSTFMSWKWHELCEQIIRQAACIVRCCCCCRCFLHFKCACICVCGGIFCIRVLRRVKWSILSMRQQLWLLLMGICLSVFAIYLKVLMLFSFQQSTACRLVYKPLTKIIGPDIYKLISHEKLLGVPFGNGTLF